MLTYKQKQERFKELLKDVRQLALLIGRRNFCYLPEKGETLRKFWGRIPQNDKMWAVYSTVRRFEPSLSRTISSRLAPHGEYGMPLSRHDLKPTLARNFNSVYSYEFARDLVEIGVLTGAF